MDGGICIVRFLMQLFVATVLILMHSSSSNAVAKAKVDLIRAMLGSIDATWTLIFVYRWIEYALHSTKSKWRLKCPPPLRCLQDKLPNARVTRASKICVILASQSEASVNVSSRVDHPKMLQNSHSIS